MINKLPDTAAAKRIWQLLALVREASPAAVAQFVGDAYSPDFAGAKPLAARIASFMEWHLRGSMEIVSIEEASEFSIEVVVEQQISLERWSFALSVETDAPWRITSLLTERASLEVAAPKGSDAEIAECFIGYVSQLASAGLYSGSVLIGRHGMILAQAAFGLANRDFEVANTIATRFNVASLTKMWTAVATCQLVEAGALALTDRLSAFHAFPDVQTAEQITVEHLLTHSSGLGDYFTDAFYARPRNKIRRIDDFLEVSSRAPLAFLPGTAWKYSNTGMVLLGRIIELVSGESYIDFLKRHLFDAVGMKDTLFPELDRVNRGIAVGYGREWSESGPTIVNNLYDNAVRGCPAGCAYATTGDIFLFAEAFKAGRLVSLEMVRQMTSETR
jgi:CubicO group peptidase (beta-lactamase class C family)